MKKRYSKLRGRILEVFGGQKPFAAAMGMGPDTLCLKLGGKSEWTRVEMVEACRLLGIPLVEVNIYFFAD